MPTIIKEGDKIGPYRVIKVFPNHRGGFAQVAMGVRDDAEGGEVLVSLKIARTDGKGGDDTFTRALSNEVDTLRRLKHPGIVHIYPIQVDNRRYSFMARAMSHPGQPWYFVMEHLAGGSVEDMIKQYGPIDPVVAAEIAQQMCMALDYMHARGYAHLDVKPNNVLFRRPLSPGELPDAVLIDFGSAQKNDRRAEVEAGALVYLPPERLRVMIGDKPPEFVTDRAAADIYAVGVTLYRMLTGQLPFSGRRNQVTTAILNETPTRPHQYNVNLQHFRELDELVMQMLDKRPERRPTAQDVATRLDQIVPPPRLGSTRALTELKNPGEKQSGGKGWKVLALLFLAAIIIETGLLAINWPLANVPGLSAVMATPAPVVVTKAPRATRVATPAPTKRSPTNTPAPTPSPTPGGGGMIIVTPGS